MKFIARAPLLPVAGRDLVTEIDLDLQQVAEDALGRRLELARAIGAWTERMERAARSVPDAPARASARL